MAPLFDDATGIFKRLEYIAIALGAGRWYNEGSRDSIFTPPQNAMKTFPSLSCLALLFVGLFCFGIPDLFSQTAARPLNRLLAFPDGVAARQRAIPAQPARNPVAAKSAPQASKNLPENSPARFVSDDPVLQKLLDRQAKLLEANQKLQEKMGPSHKKLLEIQKQIAKYRFDVRLAELEKYQPKQKPYGRAARVEALDFPMMDGSVACSYLGQIIAATVLDLPYVWREPSKDNNDYEYRRRPVARWHYDFNGAGDAQYLRVADDHSNLPQPLLNIGLDPQKATVGQQMFFLEFFPPFQGTTPAYLSLLSGQATPPAYPNNPRFRPGAVTLYNSRILGPPTEMLFVSRKPSLQEQAWAEKQGVEFDIRPIAHDALVFVVHQQNPVESLTVEQIQTIFTSRSVNWKDFGGMDADLQPKDCYRESDGLFLMNDLVLPPTVVRKLIQMPEDAEQEGTPSETVKKGMSRNAWENLRSQWGTGTNNENAPFLSIAGQKDALGYSTHYSERYRVDAPQVRVIAVDGVKANYATIAAKDYPLTFPIYMVTLKGIPSNSPTARLRDWLLTEDGQRTIRKSGFVPADPQIATE